MRAGGGVVTAAETPAEQGTEYVVLVKEPAAKHLKGAEDADVIEVNKLGDTVWREVGKSSARSADAAIREVVGRLAESGRKGTFVAIPARSFKPVTVSEKVERTLVIGS